MRYATFPRCRRSFASRAESHALSRQEFFSRSTCGVEPASRCCLDGYDGDVLEVGRCLLTRFRLVEAVQAGASSGRGAARLDYPDLPRPGGRRAELATPRYREASLRHRPTTAPAWTSQLRRAPYAGPAPSPDRQLAVTACRGMCGRPLCMGIDRVVRRHQYISARNRPQPQRIRPCMPLS